MRPPMRVHDGLRRYDLAPVIPIDRAKRRDTVVALTGSALRRGDTDAALIALRVALAPSPPERPGTAASWAVADRRSTTPQPSVGAAKS